MKRYVWIGAVLLCMGAHATENPFALDKNFKKLEQEQKALLAKLKKIAEAKELEEENKPVVEEVSVTPTVKEVVVTPNEPAKQEISETKQEEALAQQEAEKRLDMMRQKALEASRREAMLAEAKKEEEQKRLEEEKKVAEAEAAKAYEKARAERIAQEEAKKAVATKENISIKKDDVVVKSEEESTSIDDINLTREKLEEKRKADEAFAKAVLEMGEEAK